MFLSPAIGRIKPSPTLALSAQAKALKAQGIDVLDLSVGEPDMTPPPHVLEAGIKAIHDGYHYYTAVDGLPTLKAAILGKFNRDQGFTYTPPEIVVSAGAKHLIFQALLATVSKGSEVIIPVPGWVSYQDMVLFAGGTPILVPCPEDAHFKLSPEALRQAISPRTQWLILNSPSNPTGAVYTREELQALADVLADFPHVHVLSDDIYEAFTYGDQPFCSIGQIAPFLKDRLLVVNGVSKAYAMTGWRIGYGAGPAPLMRAIAMLQSQSTSNPCAIAQKAAEAALQGPQTHLPRINRQFQARRDCILAALRPIPELSCNTPEGAFYLYINCHALLNRRTATGVPLTTDGEIAAYFLDQARVCLVPGEAFGFSPYLRLSYATSEEILTTAASRLQQAIHALASP